MICTVIFLPNWRIPQPPRQHPRSLPLELPSFGKTAPSILSVKRSWTLEPVLALGHQWMMIVIRIQTGLAMTHQNMLLHDSDSIILCLGRVM